MLGRAECSVIPKLPEGVLVRSETHSPQSAWSNNKNPIFIWKKGSGVSGYSYVFDNKYSTIPENNIFTTDTARAYQDLSDGLYYFHVKAMKNSVWEYGNFLARIDATPPADFEPGVEYVEEIVVAVERALVSFFTTDNLSCGDHYEVGMINMIFLVSLS